MRLLIKRDTLAWSKVTTSIHKAQKHITILVVGQKTRTEDIIMRTIRSSKTIPEYPIILVH